MSDLGTDARDGLRFCRGRGVCGRGLRACIACAVPRANPRRVFFRRRKCRPTPVHLGKHGWGRSRGGIPCARRACLLWQLYHGRAAICARPFIFYTLCRLDILRSKALKGPALRCATCTKSRLHTLYDSVFCAARLPVFKIGKLAVVVAAAWVLDQIAARWDG